MRLKLIRISKRGPGSWNPSSALKRDCLSHIVNFKAFNYHAQNGPFIARYRLDNNNLEEYDQRPCIWEMLLQST